MADFFDRIAPQVRKCGVIPVFCPKNEAELNTFLQALIPSPVRVVEITLRNELAIGALKRIKKTDSSFIVGAGTVLSHELLDAAADAGADFLVAPGYSPALLNRAAQKGIAFLPGCATPSEIQNAMLDGCRTLKYFPAECSGGTAALKLYQGAFAGMQFVPTGGITRKNLPDYLAQDNVLACGGSFMLPKEMLAANDSEGIYRTMMECLSIRGGK